MIAANAAKDCVSGCTIETSSTTTPEDMGVVHSPRLNDALRLTLVANQPQLWLRSQVQTCTGHSVVPDHHDVAMALRHQAAHV
jgi:hypothetical protein